jgi:hypothetical protein
MEHKRKNNLNPQANKSTSPPSTSQKQYENQPSIFSNFQDQQVPLVPAVSRFRHHLQEPIQLRNCEMYEEGTNEQLERTQHAKETHGLAV